MPGSWKPNMNHICLISELSVRSFTHCEVSAEFSVQPEYHLALPDFLRVVYLSTSLLLEDIQLQHYQSCKTVEGTNW